MDYLDLSVIIPNYNKKDYLEQCVQSVVSQSIQPKEIIVVDDCSTDGSDILLIELSRKYSILHPILLKQNVGVSNARNVGLKNSKSTYITFMDSDDFYYNNKKLENEMALLYESKNPSRCISFSRVVLVDKFGQYIDCLFNKKWEKYEFPHGVIPLKMMGLLYQWRIPRDFCVSKSFVEEVGSYCYPDNYYEDLDFIMRLATNSGFFCCTYKEGTAYRQTENGLSKRPKVPHHDPVRELVDNYVSKCSSKEKMVIFFYRIVSSLIKDKNILFNKIYRYAQKVKHLVAVK